MKSATYFQNVQDNFCDNCSGDSVRMSKSIKVSGATSWQSEQIGCKVSVNEFVNGNNINSILNQKQNILYQKKFNDYSPDIDFDDDEKTNSFGLSRRIDGLYIDEKNISLQLNDPFVTQVNFDGTLSTNVSLHQSASISQLSNVIKNQQMEHFVVSGNNEIPINDIENNILRNRSKKPCGKVDGLSTASFSSLSLPSVVKQSILNQNKGELTRSITASAAATTTMTYSNSCGIQNNNSTISNCVAIKSPKNTFKNVRDGDQNPQKVFTQTQKIECTQKSLKHPSYGHFINSPARLTTKHQQASQDFSVYLPPSLTTTDNVSRINSKFNTQSEQNRHPPTIVQRRSQSTPRVQSTVLLSDDNKNKSKQSIDTSEIGIPIRPRSLDRDR